MRALKFLVPLAIFALIAWFLLKGLGRDPRELPSPLIGKAAPAFSLPRLDTPAATWSPAEMRDKVWLLNVWASWCAACVEEHPLLLEVHGAGSVPVVGLAWKDAPKNSAAWLARYRNPYSVVVSDETGKVAIDYGVYGAPETFLVDRQGMIRYKHVGPISREAWERKMLPLIQQLQARG